MNESKILLNTSGWHEEDDVFVKGAAYRNGSLIEKSALCHALRKISNKEEFCDFLRTLNGFFAIVFRKRDKIFAAVDIIRSMPLFYSEDGSTLHISDTAETMRHPLSDNQAPAHIRLEFLLTGYVTGRDTLSPSVSQLQCGECLIHRQSSKPHVQKYFAYTWGPTVENDGASLTDELNRISLDCIQRLALWADGRPIVIPLSGGYDSRLLAVLLKQIGYPRILTYTYGRENSAEVNLAHEIASALGLECRFVEYSEKFWWRWFHSPEREAYFRAAHNLVSIPHIQDWPAVWELNRNELIPPDAIIVPGHTGDFISGGHMPRDFIDLEKVGKIDFVSEIFGHHYNLWRSSFDPHLIESLRERILHVSNFDTHNHVSSERAISKYENWEYNERQAKFIVNSVRVYDFWQYDWWLPYYDLEFVTFWQKVPLKWRIGSRLYRDYVIEKYAKAAQISKQAAARRAPRVRVEKLTLTTAPYLAARYLFHLVTTDKLRQKKRPDLSYNRHPLAIFGIMDPDTFEEHKEEFRNFHSFISKTLLEGDFF